MTSNNFKKARFKDLNVDQDDMLVLTALARSTKTVPSLSKTSQNALSDVGKSVADYFLGNKPTDNTPECAMAEYLQEWGAGWRKKKERTK